MKLVSAYDLERQKAALGLSRRPRHSWWQTLQAALLLALAFGAGVGATAVQKRPDPKALQCQVAFAPPWRS